MRAHGLVALLGMLSALVAVTTMGACGDGPLHGTVADASLGSNDLIPPQTIDAGVYFDTLSGRVALRLRGCSNPAEEGCHANDAGGMHLLGIPAHDLAQIIRVKSTERPDLVRIAPNDEAHSWLFLKVTDAIEAGVETAMPKGSEGDPTFAALVRAWIEAGAPNDYLDAGDDASLDEGAEDDAEEADGGDDAEDADAFTPE